MFLCTLYTLVKSEMRSKTSVESLCFLIVRSVFQSGLSGVIYYQVLTVVTSDSHAHNTFGNSKYCQKNDTNNSIDPEAYMIHHTCTVTRLVEFFQRLVGHCLLYSYNAIPAAIETLSE